MKTRHYVITGVVTYIFFLIISIPATLITELLNERLPTMTIDGATGTVWKGTAQSITLSPSQSINDVTWSFCVWRLLTAEVCIDLDASYQSKPIHSQLGIGITGTAQARHLKAEIDAQSLGEMAGIPIGELSGNVLIQLESASWKNRQILSAIGIILWKNATFTVAETANIGDVTINLKDSAEFPLAADINNEGGDITLTGNSHINGDADYNIELKLSPNKSASNNLRSSLKMFAKPQNDGSFVLKNTGNLKQYGIM